MAEVVDVATGPALGAAEVDPPNGVTLLGAPPIPENSGGGAVPSLFSVGAAVVLAGGPPRENVGKAVVVAPSFFSSGFPSLFAVAPRPPKNPPLVVAAVEAVLSPVKVAPPKLKAGWV